MAQTVKCLPAMQETQVWSHREGKWQPTPELLPGKFHGLRSLIGYSPWVAKSRIQLSDFTFTLLKVRAGRKGWVIFVEKAGLACMDRLSSSLTFQQSSSLSQLPSFPEGKVRPAEKRHWLLISSLVAHPPADTDGARGGALGEVMRWDLWAEKKQNLLPWIIDFPVEWRWIHV